MRYEDEELDWDNRNKRVRDFVDPEYLARELDGCPSKRTMRWMLERMEEDNEVDGEGWR
jgi:hypothetical protein